MLITIIAQAALMASTPAATCPTAPLKQEFVVRINSLCGPLEHYIERHLKVAVRMDARKRAKGSYVIAGWEIGVYHDENPAAGNLLYHSPNWHGPYPSQVDAWAEAAHYWPRGPRRLAVRGKPWTVIVTCEDCATTGVGDDARFVSGRLRVRWERTIHQ